jgi:AcrR family transcriptional regulator
MEHRPYHHGALREALVETGFEAARRGGPDELGLREIAKTVGVSPTAAYRHFPSLDHLVAVVSQRAREPRGREMLAALAGPVSSDPTTNAWAHLRLAGRAYVAFALREPGLFDAAFVSCVAPDRPDEPSAWSVLLGVFDELLAVGAIDDRRHAEGPLFAWSAVHGLAMILVRRIQAEPVAEDWAIESVVEGVVLALGGPDVAGPSPARVSS